MVVRYMGTKRHMVQHVRETILNLNPRGRVVDLFSGMGSVAESFQDSISVVTNDALSFTAAISRARFTGPDRKMSVREVLKIISADYLKCLEKLQIMYSSQLTTESEAVSGTRDKLLQYMESAEHVANSKNCERRADVAAFSEGIDHYQLASLYFSAGYLSLNQSLEVDALRFAIDNNANDLEVDWLLAAWVVATSVLVNSPGHTAQYLRPNSDTSYKRIVRTWNRSLWDEFVLALDKVAKIGSENWRVSNVAHVGDALELVANNQLPNIGVVYADPPYTQDQYSRYYHVYETLYRYDFPDAMGRGRNRSDRFKTGFSLKSGVVASFHELCCSVARMKVPLVISYPSSGLLNKAGYDVADIARKYFSEVDVISYKARHSTMGASTGASKVDATENLYVCE